MDGLSPISNYDVTIFDKDLEKIFQNIVVLSGENLLSRLKKISEFFLEKPYEWFACGEGPQARFNQKPLYRTDVFDCVTYLNLVLALLFSDCVDSFRERVIKLNYYNCHVSYLNRYHFMCVDWNKVHQQTDFINDITTTFVDSTGENLNQFAYTVIDRPSWFLRRTFADIHSLRSLTLTEAQKLLAEIHALSDKVEAEQSIIPFIPIDKLFVANKVNMQVFSQIPDGSILETIRPNWQCRDSIGTNLNISHVGFVFRRNDRWIYRQASSLQMKVCDVDLADYLYSYISHATVKGINIQVLSSLDK